MTAIFDRPFTANYPGPAPSALPDNMVGPNTMGEYFVAESCEDIPGCDMHKVTFRLLRREERDVELNRQAAAASAHMRIAALFGRIA